MVLKLAFGLLTIFFSTPNLLMAVEGTTGHCMMEQQCRVFGVTPAQRSFLYKTRIACTDAGSDNAPCERAYAHTVFGSADLLLHFFCQVHKLATTTGKVFALAELDRTIRGMVYVALSLRYLGAMVRFRTALRKEIRSRFRLLRGQPSRDAQQYKANILNMFVSHASSTLTKRLLLVLFPNGDWRSRFVEDYIPFGRTDIDEASAVEFVVEGLMTTFAATMPTVYNKARWTGADVATDELGVFEACHRLLTPTFIRFAASYTKGAVRDMLLAAVVRFNEWGSAEQTALEDLNDLSDGGNPDSTAGPPVEQSAGSATSESTDIGFTSEVHARYRRTGLEFLLRHSLPFIILVRLLQEPLRRYQTYLFDLGSDTWEVKQLAKAAKALARGESGPGVREYRASVLAGGVADALFWDQRHMAFTSATLLSVVAPVACTFAFRSLAFRALSRTGCAFNYLIAEAHRSFPMRLFALLADPSLGASFDTIPDCLLGQWARRFKSQYGTFTSDLLLTVLAAIAVLLWVDTTQIERRNATIRRLVMGASLHTWKQDVQDLATQMFLLMRRKKGGMGCCGATRHPMRSPKSRAKSHDDFGE